MNILVTGSAGFIGSAVALALLKLGYKVTGVDNLNDYYDVNLKRSRLSRLLEFDNYLNYQVDIENGEYIANIFKMHKFDYVVHLAAQAGVRYSISNPAAYVESNIIGYFNVLDNARLHNVKNFIYASSSSVYGANQKFPYSVGDNVDHPLSFYAATKKSNELLAHTYSNIYGLPTVGLRFFTVYGPWSRPDMAFIKFASAILKDEAIDLYNYGNHSRDFTYIDDIVNGLLRVLFNPPKASLDIDPSLLKPGTSYAPYRIYNIGSGHPVSLLDCVKELENLLGVNAKINLLPMQQGDVKDTFADINSLVIDHNFKIECEFKVGLSNFVDWFRQYYMI